MPGNVSFVAVTPQPDGTDVRTSFPVSLACAAQCAAVQRMLDGSLGSSSLGAFSFGQAGGQQAGGQQAGGQQAGGQQAGGQAGGGQKVVEGDISLSEEEEDEEEGGMSGGDSDSDSDYRVDDRAGTAKSGSSASGSSASGSGASIGDSDFAAAKKIKTEPSSADSSADSSTDSSAESSFKEQVVAEQQGDKEFMVRGSTESVRAAAQFVNNIDKYASPVLPVTFPVKLSSEPSAKDPSQPLTGGVFVEPFFNASGFDHFVFRGTTFVSAV
jgi:hypothetical protein